MVGPLEGISPQLFIVLATLFSTLVGVITFLAFTRSELTRLQAGYDALTAYLGDGESKDIILELTSAIKAVEYECETRRREIDHVYETLAACVQKVSLIRYDAFGNASGSQSFSAALLDAEDNGFVISSLYGREHSTVYAKPIRGGQSKLELTDEERRAVAAARKKARNRSYYGAPREESSEDD